MSKEIQDANLSHKAHIVKQLKAFSKNTKYFDLYKGLQPQPNECLIRLFSYSPPKEHRPSGNLIVPHNSNIQGADRQKVQKYFLNDIVMPFGIVIKAGESPEGHQYKAGDMVSFPTNKVSGREDNPAYIHWLQAQDVAMATPKGTAPEATIPSVRLYYANYQFSRLGNIYPDDEDLLTYLLPSFEFRPYTGIK